MAQLLEGFEKEVEPHVPDEAAKEFKALVRRKITALATDCLEVMDMEDDSTVMNGAARDLKDRISPDAAFARTGTTPARR